MNTLTLKLDISIDGFVAPEDHDVLWITADFDDEIEAFELDLRAPRGPT